MDTMRHTPAVTFQRPSVSQPGDEPGEVNYVRPPGRTENKPQMMGKKCLIHLLIITVSWGILLLVMVPRIYLTSVLSENNAELMTENQQLSHKNKELQEKIAELEEFNVSRTQSIIDASCSIPKNGRVTSSLSDDNAKLRTENQQLSSKNQELQADKRHLKEKIAELEEFNMGRTQSIIKDYCPIPKNGGERRCDVCENGWKHDEWSCYAVNDAKPGERRSWEDAEKDCRAKGSHLAIIGDDTEKWFIMVNSRGHEGFWIGLKVEDGGWKWLDGTTLSQSSWIEAPRDGHCAASVNSGDLRALNCTEKNQWICEKKALTL